SAGFPAQCKGTDPPPRSCYAPRQNPACIIFSLRFSSKNSLLMPKHQKAVLRIRFFPLSDRSPLPHGMEQTGDRISVNDVPGVGALALGLCGGAHLIPLVPADVADLLRLIQQIVEQHGLFPVGPAVLEQ